MGKCIGFGAEFARPKLSNKIEAQRYLDQQACHQERTFVVKKCSKFLWPVTTSMGKVEPLR